MRSCRRIVLLLSTSWFVERLNQVIFQQPLAARPGDATIYSCMGYILLGKILELVGG